MKKIWYIADSKGFRAFGDVVPNTDWSDQPSSPPVGASVIPPKAPPTTGAREEPPTPATPKQPPQAAPPRAEPVPQPLKAAATEPEENKVPARVAQNTQAVETSAKKDAPSKIPGTSFVLLSNTRLPIQGTTVPKASAIRPRPVVVTGAPASPIRGILSAPRAINVLGSRGTTAGSIATQKQVPRPSKVEGKINLDNFLRPSRPPANSVLKTHPTTPDHLNADYYYYDDYYSNPKKESGAARSRKSKPRSVRSEEESSESFEDFDYVQDSSDEKRRRRKRKSNDGA